MQWLTPLLILIEVSYTISVYNRWLANKQLVYFGDESVAVDVQCFFGIYEQKKLRKRKRGG